MAQTANTDPDETQQFTQQDKRWNGPRFFVTGIITLAIALPVIYILSTFGGCSVAIVP